MITIKYSESLLFLSLLLAIFVGVNMFYINNLVCPDDFKYPNERFDLFNKWENEFRKNNPSANISDLAKARKKFYIKNKCKEAAQEPNLKDYGITQTGEIAQQLLNIIENYNLED